MATVYEKIVRNGNYKRIELGKVWPSKQRDTQKKKKKSPNLPSSSSSFLSWSTVQR